jgi:hypothetical protein
MITNVYAKQSLGLLVTGNGPYGSGTTTMSRETPRTVDNSDPTVARTTPIL